MGWLLNLLYGKSNIITATEAIIWTCRNAPDGKAAIKYSKLRGIYLEIDFSIGDLKLPEGWKLQTNYLTFFDKGTYWSTPTYTATSTTFCKNHKIETFSIKQKNKEEI